MAGRPLILAAVALASLSGPNDWLFPATFARARDCAFAAQGEWVAARGRVPPEHLHLFATLIDRLAAAIRDSDSASAFSIHSGLRLAVFAWAAEQLDGGADAR